MEEIKLQLNEGGEGCFYIFEEGEQLGEMAVSITDKTLTIYHTEVLPKAEGRGLAKKLFDAMIEHARKNGLQLIPYCPYVLAQLKRHPEAYADVWK